MKNLKLFKVKVTYETVVLAQDREIADKMFQFGMGEIDDNPTTISSEPISTIEDIPPKWCGKCVPWGDVNLDERTIKEIISDFRG